MERFRAFEQAVCYLCGPLEISDDCDLKFFVLNKRFLNLFKFLLFLSIGAGILYYVYLKQDAAYREDCALRNVPVEDCSLIQKVIADFGIVNYWWILLVIVAFAISNISRAIRWNMLLGALGYRPRLINGFMTIMIGYFTNLGLPRAGEVIRAGTMARYERIPAEKVMGTVVADRVVDVLSIFVMSALALLLEFDKLWALMGPYFQRFWDNLTSNGLVLTLVLVVVAGMFALIYRFRNRLAQNMLFQKIAKLAAGLWQGIQTVRQLDRPWVFLLHSINIWVMFFVMTYFCFLAFGPTAHLPLTVALVVFTLGTWGMVVPSPGGMGTFHLLAQIGLTAYGVSGDNAFSWANISFFSVQLGSNILLGLLAMLLLPVINKNYVPYGSAS